jgi:hypothetical protein
VIKEALQLLFETAHEAQTPKPIPSGRNQKTRRYCLPNGSIAETTDLPDPISATVNDIPSLQQAVSIAGFDPWRAAVWVRHSLAVLIPDGIRDGSFDLGYCESRIQFDPGLNPVLLTLGQLSQSGMSHNAALQMLRSSLYETDYPESFLSAVCNLRFDEESQTSASSSRTVDAMGKSIRAQVKNADQLPDSVTFKFDAYPGLEGVDCPLSIECYVNTYPAEGKIAIVPKGGQIEKAMRDAASALAAAIQQSLPDATVLLGKFQ